MSGKTKLKKYALDSSARFYPFLTTRKSQSLFCVGVALNESVDKEILRRAVNDVIARFPLYKTRLAKGYNKYYLKENVKEVNVFDIDGRILKPIDTRLTNGYQFRLACKDNVVSLEMFHALTDANGAMAFLFAIVRRYRELQGVEFDAHCEVFAYDSQPAEGECEDAFKKYYKRISLGELNLKGMAGGVPHRIKGTLAKSGYFLEHGVFDTDVMLKNAKEAGVSLTAYVAGAVAYSLLQEAKKPIVIMIPVNLRKMFPSNTLANFITFVRLIIKKGECATFEDCVKSCADQLAEKASKEKMQAFISTMVRAQRNLLFRAIPLPLMWIFMRLGRLFLKSRQTIIISNLGRYELPEELGIDDILVNLNVSKNNVQNLGIASFKGKVSLTFTSAIEQPDMPKKTFAILEEQGNINTRTDFICVE